MSGRKHKLNPDQPETLSRTWQNRSTNWWRTCNEDVDGQAADVCLERVAGQTGQVVENFRTP